MAKIITQNALQKEIRLIKKSGKSIVLTGGCFDILHIGHIKFLQEAKKHGEFLFVLLESNETVSRLKGKNRPYFPQMERAEVLSSIKYIDYVILLPLFNTDEEYDKLVLLIKPDIIAITQNDPYMEKKRHQAQSVNGKLKIIPFIKTYSTSKLAKIIGIE